MDNRKSLARTTWVDSSVFGLPHATSFNASRNIFMMLLEIQMVATTYYQHETGTDQVKVCSNNNYSC